MKQLLSLFFLSFFTAIICLGQETPTPEGYKLQASPNIVPVYRNVDNKPELTIRNQWNHIYWFKVDNTIEGQFVDPATKVKYIRITIPSRSRYDDATKKWLEGSSSKGYDKIVNWAPEEKIDGSDFNTWLWIRESDFTALKVDYLRRKVKSDIVLSGLTVPFKYRTSVGEESNSVINGDINIGSFIGWRVSNFVNLDLGVSVGGHFGLTSISLNSSNNSKVTAKNTETIQGFNYGGGIIFDVKNQFQIGFVLGQDYGMGNLSDSYIYQKRNWYSFSLNYNFINGKKEKEDTNKNAARKEKEKE